MSESEKWYSVDSVIAKLRQYGVEVTEEELIQDMMNDPNTIIVNDGDTRRVYKRDTGDLLAEITERRTP